MPGPRRILILTMKWLVIPIALGLIGFFLVGPRLGRDALNRIPEINRIIPQQAGPETAPSAPPKKPEDGPRIDISVKPFQRT